MCHLYSVIGSRLLISNKWLTCLSTMCFRSLERKANVETGLKFFKNFFSTQTSYLHNIYLIGAKAVSLLWKQQVSFIVERLCKLFAKTDGGAISKKPVHVFIVERCANFLLRLIEKPYQRHQFMSSLLRGCASFLLRQKRNHIKGTRSCLHCREVVQAFC